MNIALCSDEHRSARSVTDTDAAAPTTVLVFDAAGVVFDRLRRLDLSVALWRVLDTRHVAPPSVIDLSILAAYAAIDWDVVDRLPSQAPALIITTNYERGEADEAFRRGLIGYLDAAIPASALDRAVRGARRGEPAFSRELLGAWFRERRSLVRETTAIAGGLTPRQREILALIARGATDKEIGATLGIATSTAQKHVSNLLRRLGVSSRAAAVGRVADSRSTGERSVVDIADLRRKQSTRAS